MKKSLLSLLGAVCLSLGASAQVAKPVPANYLDLATLHGESVEEDAPAPDSVYVYNVEGNAFLCGSNAWGTQTSITNDGLLYVLTLQEDGSYSLKTSSGAKAGKYVFRDNFSGCFIDMGSQGHEYWNITRNASNGFYRFRSALSDTNWGQDSDDYDNLFFGWSGTGTIIDANINAANEGIGIDWAFVSAEEYEKWHAIKPLYDASQILKASIDKAKAEAPNLDLSAEEAVYMNVESTLEEYTAAEVSVREKLTAYNASMATVENPSDATDLIVNPNFDGIKFDGWKGSSFGAGGATDECGERYSMNYDTYQEIENVPNGVYRINVNAFYRAGSIDNDWNTKDDPSFRHAKLYAISGADTLEIGIRSLASVSTENTDLGGTLIGPSGNRYAPNSMQDFVRFENAGIDMDNSIVLPVLDGKLKIGVKKSTLIDTDWTITDTWRLTYYGNGLDAYQMWSEDVIKAIAGDLEDYITEDTYYCRAEIANFQEALKAAREAQTPEDIHTYTMAMTEVTKRALASIEAYNNYKALVDKYCEGISDGTYDYNGSLWEDFCDYVQAEEENTLQPGELTGEEIAAKGVELNKMFDDAVKASIKEGDDCTAMLVNPNFTDANGKGWTWNKNDNVTALNARGGNSAFYCAEAYGGWDSNAGFLFDVYQEVNDVPDGIYQISANCFYRWADNGQFTGEETVPAVIYMNDFQSPVQHIASNAVAAEDIMEEDGTTMKEGWYGSWVNTDGIGYVPNSMDAASNAFEKDMYKQTVYGLVEGGKMRIGIKKEIRTSENRHWCLWTNFKLTFAGKSVEAVSSVIESTLPRIEEYLSANKDNLTDPTVEDLQNAIDAAQAALDGSDGDEMFEALKSLNAAYEAAQINAVTMADIQPIYDTLNGTTADQIGEIEDDELSATYEKYYTIVDEEEYKEYTTEELTTFIDKVNAFIDEVREAYVAWEKENIYQEIEGLVADASDEDPIELTDYLVNPDLATGNADGWTLDMTTYTNKGYQSNNTYTGDTITVNGMEYTPSCNQFIEVWRSGNSPILGNIYQEILLPAGTYTLGADMIASYQGDASVEVVGCYLYAGETHMQVGTGNGKPEHFELTFKLEEKSLIKVGINCSEETNANWLAADNFTLTTYGKNSQKGENGEENAISSITTNAQKAIFDITGRKVSKTAKGLYIINGKKVVVK